MAHHDHDYTDESGALDDAVVQRALAILADHFDAAQVMACRHDPESKSETILHDGIGSWHARFGMISEIVILFEREAEQTGR
jgi:hypothetical protein